MLRYHNINYFHLLWFKCMVLIFEFDEIFCWRYTSKFLVRFTNSRNGLFAIIYNIIKLSSLFINSTHFIFLLLLFLNNTSNLESASIWPILFHSERNVSRFGISFSTLVLIYIPKYDRCKRFNLCNPYFALTGSLIFICWTENNSVLTQMPFSMVKKRLEDGTWRM